jgi:hypothetical protein
VVPGHFAERHFAERHFAERTVCRKDNLPKIDLYFVKMFDGTYLSSQDSTIRARIKTRATTRFMIRAKNDVR